MTDLQVKNNPLEKWLPAALAVLAATIYGFTLAPDLVEIDAGELAAVQVTGGIAHPTGYPLFTLLGWLFTRIQLFSTLIFQLNVLAMLYTAGGVFFFASAAGELLQFHRIRRVKKTSGGELLDDPEHRRWFPILNAATISGGTLFLAFSPTFWAQSTSTEVYSLQILLLSLVTWLLIRALHPATGREKDWYWLAGGLAFLFANHLTAIFLLPGLALAYFRTFGFKKEAFLRIAKMLGIFFPMLVLLYLWLPLRAATDPALNWGDPDSWEYFWRHVKGQQFSVWLFSSSKVAGQNLQWFFSQLAGQFAYAGILLALTGLIWLWKRAKSLFWWVLIGFFFCVFYAVNYAIKDLEPYFLFAYFCLALSTVAGIRWVGMSLVTSPRTQAMFALGLGLTGLLQIPLHYEDVDRSGQYIFRQYTTYGLEHLPENALVFGYQWDYFISPAYYLQQVEGLRPDVAVIDKELLRRSWYYDQLEQNYPEVMAPIQAEIRRFKASVKPFERGEKYDAERIETDFRALMVALLEKNEAAGRRIFIGPEILEKELRGGELPLPPVYQVVPFGVLLELTRVQEYVPGPPAPPSYQTGSREDMYTAFIIERTAALQQNRIGYEQAFQEK